MTDCDRHRSTRRQFIGSATIAGASTLLPLNAASIADEPPPETPKLRLLWSPVICLAPQFVAEELLRAEGFTDVSYVNPARGGNEALRQNEADLSLLFGPPQVVQIDAGAPIVVVAGSHAGCVELIGGRGLRSTRDLKGRAVAAARVGSDSHVFISMFVAYVGLDPQRDIDWVMEPSWEEAERLFLEGKVDAVMTGPPRSFELRARRIGQALVNTTTDRPWSQYFCCLVTARKDFVLRNPVATKRAIRALLKSADVCALEPERVARLLMDKQLSPRYEYALQTVKELPYGRWRDYDAEAAVRFYALRLHDVGMVKSSPQKIIAQGTDWRFLNELKKELKG